MIKNLLKLGLCLALSFTAWILSPAQSVVSPSPSSYDLDIDKTPLYDKFGKISKIIFKDSLRGDFHKISIGSHP